MANKAKCTLNCLNTKGETGAIIEIISSEKKNYSGDLPPELLELSEEDANSIKEHPVQLRENAQYLCKILNPDKSTASDLRLRKNPLIQSSKFSGETSFTIHTKSSAGTLSLQVVDDFDHLIGSVFVEIRSVKLDYRNEYRGMVCAISEKARDLLFQLGGATQVSMEEEWSEDEPTLVQQIEFLRALLHRNDLWNSIDKLVRSPHEKLDLQTEVVPVSKVGSRARDVLRQLASSQPRVTLPTEHKLRNKISSLPARVTVKSKVRNYDTSENRFIKYALREFTTFLQHTIETLKSLPQIERKSRYEIVCKDCSDLKEEFDRRLGAAFFKTIAEPKFLPFGSSVLQKKAGYREVFQTWLGFRASSILKWEGSEDIFGGGKSEFNAGKKDLPNLYEAWIFFELLDLFKEKFEIDEEDLNNFMRPNGKLGEFTLKQGVVKSFKGRSIQGLSINGCLEYNRSFSTSENYELRSSWTTVLRPDYTITFWPNGMALKEAEKIGSAVNVHFDAKYRVENIEQLFGKSESSDQEITEEKRLENEGNYKKADLLKMHAYRDAIRRSEGAYVLYPGKIHSQTKEELISKENRQWKGFHELLPGLGAFALRPDSTGKAIGIEHVSEFLDDIISQYANRASHLAHTRYGSRRVIDHSKYRVEEPEKVSFANKLFEELSFDKKDLSSGQEIIVICGMIKNESHLNWVKSNKVYNFRFDKDRKGYLPTLIPEFPKAKFLLLYGSNGKPLNGLMKIKGYHEKSISELISLNYPKPNGDRYLCFEVESTTENSKWSWERFIEINEQMRKGYRNKKPFQITLNQLLTTLEI